MYKTDTTQENKQGVQIIIIKMLFTHSHPRGTLKWPYANTRLTAHFMCGLMSDLAIFKFKQADLRPKKRSADKFDSFDPSYCQFLIKL